MYSVSNDYKIVMQQPVLQFDLKGRLTNTGAFNADNILAGSLSITNQCSDGDEILIGSVFVGEFRATFIGTEDIHENDTITVQEGLRKGDGTYEYVPLGAFKVAEATRTRSGIEVVAYDYMSKFDRRNALTYSSGTPYQWLGYICTQVGMELANTQAQIEAMTNGTITMQLYSENDIQTYRDMIKYLSAALGGFACADREGRLKIVPLVSSTVDYVNTNRRYRDDEFSLYKTHYTGLRITDLANLEEHVYGTEEGIVYDFGSNPFLQDAANMDGMCMALLNNVLAGMQYTPFKAKLGAGACYDLGDMLCFYGGRARELEETYCCITHYEWTYGGGTSLEGAGKNPDIMNSKKNSSSGGGGGGASGASEVRYYHFTNLNDITIYSGQKKKIIDIRFVNSKATIVLFQAEILLGTDSAVSGEPTIGIISYRLNETEDNIYYPEETWVEDGKHILHLFYGITVDEASSNHFEVYLEAEEGGINIGAQKVKAWIYGQGLAAQEAEWDGLINAEDNLHGYEADLGGITDVINLRSADTILTRYTPHTRALSDTVGQFDLEGIGVAEISDILQIDKEPLTTLTWGEVGVYTWGYISDNFMW